MAIEWFFRQAWRWKAGRWCCGSADESPVAPGGHPSLEELRETEWNPEFVTRMQNRLVMGSFRYGLWVRPEKWDSDFIAGIRKKLVAYEESGNTEHLVDVGNYALLEFTRPKHPDAHFRAEDDHCHCPE